MRLHREGNPTILLILALTILTAFAAWFCLSPILAWPLIFAMLCLLGIVVWFFRVPVRDVANDFTTVLSPCDGKVVVMEEVTEGEYFNDRRLQVSIFMSPLNVHINYNPISGTVAYRKYHPGKYLVAWHPKSSTENERSTVVIKDGEGGEVLVRQIAGALARRICTYPVEGDEVIQGSEMGFIKFGSRVDLFLPTDARIRVKIGDVVQGARSVIVGSGARS